MTNIDQDPLFNYLAIPENFATAKEIYNFFPSLRDQLYSEFWKYFHQLLQQQYENTNWKVSPPEDVLKDYNGYWVQPRETDFGIGLAISGLQSKIYFGLCINPNDKRIERDKCENYLINHNLSFDRSRLGEWWLGRSSEFIDISLSGQIEEILPAKREATAAKVLTAFQNFFERYNEDVMEIYRLHHSG